MLGGLDGRGHFKTIFVFFRGRALNKDIGKYSYFKAKIFSLLMKSLWSILSYLKF